MRIHIQVAPQIRERHPTVVLLMTPHSIAPPRIRYSIKEQR